MKYFWWDKTCRFYRYISRNSRGRNEYYFGSLKVGNSTNEKSTTYLFKSYTHSSINCIFQRHGFLLWCYERIHQENPSSLTPCNISLIILVICHGIHALFCVFMDYAPSETENTEWATPLLTDLKKMEGPGKCIDCVLEIRSQGSLSAHRLVITGDIGGAEPWLLTHPALRAGANSMLVNQSTLRC